MLDSADMIAECERVLANAGQNIVSELLRFSDDFVEWTHVPEKDVHDKASASQYYYHAHPKTVKGSDPGPHDDEHGHFHTFVRGPAIPEGMEPVPANTDEAGKQANKKRQEIVSHIIGIGMDSCGRPNKLFTTNRWVTGEDWFKADDIIACLESYEIDHAYPSWPVNLWVTHMLKLYRPEIETLLHERDRVIAKRRDRDPEANIFEDRQLEVISSCPVDLDKQREYIAGLVS